METQQEVKNTGPRCLARLHWIRDTITDVQEGERGKRKRVRKRVGDREQEREKKSEREREKVEREGELKLSSTLKTVLTTSQFVNCCELETEKENILEPSKARLFLFIDYR